MPFRGVVDGYTAGEAQQLDVNIDEALRTHASSGALPVFWRNLKRGKAPASGLPV